MFLISYQLVKPAFFALVWTSCFSPKIRCLPQLSASFPNEGLKSTLIEHRTWFFLYKLTRQFNASENEWKLRGTLCLGLKSRAHIIGAVICASLFSAKDANQILNYLLLVYTAVSLDVSPNFL